MLYIYIYIHTRKHERTHTHTHTYFINTPSDPVKPASYSNSAYHQSGLHRVYVIQVDTHNNNNNRKKKTYTDTQLVYVYRSIQSPLWAARARIYFIRNII